MSLAISEIERRNILAQLSKSSRMSSYRPWSLSETTGKIAELVLASEHTGVGFGLGFSTGSLIGLIVGLVTTPFMGVVSFTTLLLIGTAMGMYRGFRIARAMVERHNEDVERGVEFYFNLSRDGTAPHLLGLEFTDG